MLKKSRRLVALFMAILLLVMTAGLAGCGGDEGDGAEFTIGCLLDATGPAALAVRDTYNGIRDYLKMVEEENLLPDLKISLVTFDTKSDPGRIPVGYEWVKGKGANLLLTMAPGDALILRSRLEEDGMPCFTVATEAAILGQDWVVGFMTPAYSSGENIIHWIEEDWAGSEPARVGIVGAIGISTSADPIAAITAWCAESESANIELVTTQLAPSTTSSWISEVQRVQSCDYVYNGLVGPAMATFERDLQNSGWQGVHVGVTQSFIGFWHLTDGIVPRDQLEDYFADDPYAHWNDGVSFIADLKEYTQKYLGSDEATRVMKGNGRIGGWGTGMVITEALRLAVGKVGAENLDSSATKDALWEVDLTVEGFGNNWKLSGNINTYCQTGRVMNWDMEAEEWVEAYGWYRPPSLTKD